ncbi:MAG: leucine-rich repeat domain-containing protein, partial [Eubacteriales bacterium]
LQPATCTTTGLKSRTCYVCSHYEESIISKVSHEGEWVVTTPATCEENGVQQQTCINCGQVTNKALSKLGHDMQEGTCTTPSICSRCNYEEWVGHKYGEERVIEEPDCARYGYAQKKCEKCGDISTRNIDPVGHEFGEWTVRKEYNCLEDGKERRTCTVCQKAEDRVVEKLGHDFGNEVCYYNKKCSRCDEINQNPHVYGEDGCTVCGLPYTDINYKLSSDGTYYTATKINEYHDGVIFVRPTYDGKPVRVGGELSIPNDVKEVILPNSITDINYSTFSKCSALVSISIDEINENYKSIDGNLYSKDGKTLIRYAAGKTDTSFIIPDTVTEIGDYAFYNCSSLTSVTIGNGVTSIGRWAFDGCSGLTSIEIPDSVTSISYSAFSGCTGLTSIVIPGSVESIGEIAFSNCTGLTSVTIESGVTSIGNQAFEYCSSLTSIEIPDSVISIGVYAFSECSDLTSVIIGNGVDSIGEFSFYNCSSLTSVTIGNGVTSIGQYAFAECSNLTSIEVPDSVESIGNFAFINCSNLTSITYNGTMQQWNDISKGTDWNSYTGDYTIVCTDGTIKKNG